MWRQEFPQVPGWPIPWLGPYTSHWLTAEAEELVRYMEAEHVRTRPHPADPTIFERFSGNDRLACACSEFETLEHWFGDYLVPLQNQGAHVSEYVVPRSAIVQDSPDQLLFIYRMGDVASRSGTAPPGPLIRSSAGSRSAIIASGDGKYDTWPPRRQAEINVPGASM